MKLLKIMGFSLLVALSIVACSKKGEEGAEGAAQEQVQQAASGKQQERFAALLKYVPENTSWLFANELSVPENVREFQLKRAQSFADSFSGLMASESEETAQTEDSTETETTLETQETADAPAGSAVQDNQFLQALLKELTADLSTEGLKKNGLSPDAHGVLYGYKLMPVLRVELSDKEAFKAMLKRVEEQSGSKVEWQKCDGMDCLLASQNEDGGAALVLSGKMISAAFFPNENKDKMLAHLAGKALPEQSYTTAEWKKFLSANQYQGYGEGFLKLDEVVDKLEPLALEQEKKLKGEAFDEQAFKGCFAVARRHVHFVPELIFGTRELEEKTVDYEMVMKTTPEVSAVLKGIPNKLDGLQQPENPVFSFGVNINFPKMRDAISQYVNFLATAAEEEKCDSIDSVQLKKAVGGISMAMSMGLSQFKSVSVALDKVELDDQGQPEKVEAYGTIVADDPVGLLQMLAMVNPGFASLQVPDDGSVVQLPAGLLPPNPLVPTLALSRKGDQLNVLAGNDAPQLQTLDLQGSTFMWSTVDNKRYYKLFGSVMENLPASQQSDEDPQQTKKVMQMLQSMGDLAGVVSQQVGADDRGIVINYHVNYQ